MKTVHQYTHAIRQLVKVAIAPFQDPHQVRNRKQYQRAYQRMFRQKYKIKEFYFSKREFARLEKASESHNQKAASFGKACIFAYLDNTYIVPDQEILQKLLLGIRRIGNNINQISKYANRVKTLGLFNAGKVLRYLEKLEQEIELRLSTPPDLISFLENHLVSCPEQIPQIASILSKHQKS